MKKQFIPVNKIQWTDKMDQYLKDNYEKMTNTELSSALNIKLTSTRTRLYELGFKRMDLEYWTEEQTQFVKENYTNMGDSEIAEIFNEKYHKAKGWSKKHIEKKRRYLKLKRTVADKLTIHARNIDQGRFAMCAVNMWKTRGVNDVHTVVQWQLQYGPVLFIKLENGYIKLAHYNYIQVHGEVPKDYVIRHKDGNPLNCNIENLEEITKAENQLKNSESDVTIASRIVPAGCKGYTPELRELRDEILKYPELLDLKRKQLQLNKLIKNEK